MTEPETADAATRAVYLYCLARGDFDPADLDAGGMDDGGPVDLIRFHDLVAVVSAVNVDEFHGPAADARMDDLAWVAPRACRHETLVESVMRASPVVPARFGTLFSSRDRLVAWLAAHYRAVADALARFEGHEEWAVKGRLDRQAAEEPLLRAALARTTRSASPGARYLEERRIRAGIGEELTAWSASVRESGIRQLRDSAVDFRERAVSAGESNQQGVPIFNWAFLVPRRRLNEFRACVERLNTEHAERGLALECSGPWPPYSFCPELERDGAG